VGDLNLGGLFLKLFCDLLVLVLVCCLSRLGLTIIGAMDVLLGSRPSMYVHTSFLGVL
jgi:hypothetical protein